VKLVVAYIGDGYLYGASSSSYASDPSYWRQLQLDREPFALHYAHRVPKKLAEELEAQGTSEQQFSDGYDAANAAAPYVNPDPFYESEEEAPESAGEKRMTRRKENPMTDTQRRWLWTGALGAVLGVTIGAIAYASGKATGASECQSKSQVLNLPGAGAFQNTYPSGSTVAINLPTGATWQPSGLQIMVGNFSLLAAPSSGNASAQIVYNGGGGKVVASWTDSGGNAQQTELDFNG
jgi:hypothetical protein